MGRIRNPCLRLRWTLTEKLPDSAQRSKLTYGPTKLIIKHPSKNECLHISSIKSSEEWNAVCNELLADLPLKPNKTFPIRSALYFQCSLYAWHTSFSRTDWIIQLLINSLLILWGMPFYMMWKRLCRKWGKRLWHGPQILSSWINCRCVAHPQLN